MRSELVERLYLGRTTQGSGWACSLTSLVVHVSVLVLVGAVLVGVGLLSGVQLGVLSVVVLGRLHVDQVLRSQAARRGVQVLLGVVDHVLEDRRTERQAERETERQTYRQRQGGKNRGEVNLALYPGNQHLSLLTV